MTDDISRALIKANTRLSDASLAIGQVFHDLYGNDGLDTQFRDEYFLSLEPRIFAIFQEAMTVAHAINDIERQREEWLKGAVTT